MVRKEYGNTTPTCTFCGEFATRRTKEGMKACRRCAEFSIGANCPGCGKPLETRHGKFGGYFYCWDCNKNWSPAKIKGLR